MRFRVALTLALVVALLGSACSRDDTTDATSSETAASSATTGTSSASGLDAGAFGDLGEVCSAGDAKPVTGQTGVDGTTIKVATVSDRGYAGRPGLTREFHDIATAVTKWCNDHGGVRGYRIEPDLRDAALTNYAPTVVESCDEDFFLVGGGAALDESGVKEQLKCGLPNIAGYVVSAQASGADLTVQPMPNPTQRVTSGDLAWLKTKYPDSIDKIGILTADFPATVLVADRIRESAESQGYKIVSTQKYNPLGESNWTPFVQNLKEHGVEGVFYTGEPETLAALLKTMKSQDYTPKFIRTDANIYDQNLIKVAGTAADIPVYVNDFFFPFEKAKKNPATQQYLDLLDQYGPSDSRVALLGLQGLSGWMLFFKMLGACADAGTVTRDCVYEKARATKDWSGGGLHVPTDPGSGVTPECFALAKTTPDGFEFPEVTGFGTSELADFFTCNPDFVVALKGDYGAGEKCPSGTTDPLPSECAAS